MGNKGRAAMSFEIALLHRHPDRVAEIAEGYLAEWPEWYGPGGPGDALADLTARAAGEGLPLGLIALTEGRAVGACAIAPTSIASYAHLTPWLVGLWTNPPLRRRGIGAALIMASRPAAAQMGYRWLYAATSTAAGLLARDGWSLVATDGGQAIFSVGV